MNKTMVKMRNDGYSIAEIADAAGVSERQVQTVMRKHGLCRDQRPTREYTVTVMVPEIITIGEASKSQAARAARALYNDNVRIEHVEPKE